ncbi:MAG: triose-phosphate isomerase [Patescibacteria group bacterium]
MAKKIIIGNWKMNPATKEEAGDIFFRIALGIRGLKKVSIVVCIPAIFIEAIGSLKLKGLSMGAENCFFDEIGPYTGEVSPTQLKNFGVSYVILGHSERRVLGEDNELISKKIKSAVKSGLKVIFCVGENSRDEAGEYLNFIRAEVVDGLSKIKKEDLKNLIIAYEPIWAIGKNAIRPATPEDAHQATLFLKKILVEIFGRDSGLKIPIIYGGSVDRNNADDMLRYGAVDGLLVGRESLNSEKFVEIANIANNI